VTFIERQLSKLKRSILKFIVSIRRSGTREVNLNMSLRSGKGNLIHLVKVSCTYSFTGSVTTLSPSVKNWKMKSIGSVRQTQMRVRFVHPQDLPRIRSDIGVSMGEVLRHHLRCQCQSRQVLNHGDTSLPRNPLVNMALFHIVALLT